MEKLLLPQDGIDASLLKAFSAYEAKNLQFGLDWLSNLASHALQAHLKAAIFIARRGADDFVALPVTLNTRNGDIHSLATFTPPPFRQWSAPKILKFYFLRFSGTGPDRKSVNSNTVANG
ncbi:MAG: hypothetical protein R3E50_13635 [Halioglobus sp.]